MSIALVLIRSPSPLLTRGPREKGAECLLCVGAWALQYILYGKGHVCMLCTNVGSAIHFVSRGPYVYAVYECGLRNTFCIEELFIQLTTLLDTTNGVNVPDSIYHYPK